MLRSELRDLGPTSSGDQLCSSNLPGLLSLQVLNVSRTFFIVLVNLGKASARELPL